MQDSRVSERERQREHRRRRREQGFALPPSREAAEGSTEVKGGGEVPVSLAGCAPNIPEIIEQIAKDLDTVVDGLDEVSLAGLQGQLLEMMENIAKKLAKLGLKNRPVTGRLNSSTIENYAAKTPEAGSGCHWPAMTVPAGSVT